MDHPELQALAKYRLDNDLTYRQLADMVGGTTHATLFNVLKGKHPPMDRTLHKIRRFLRSQAKTRRGEPATQGATR